MAPSVVSERAATMANVLGTGTCKCGIGNRCSGLAAGGGLTFLRDLVTLTWIHNERGRRDHLMTRHHLGTRRLLRRFYVLLAITGLVITPCALAIPDSAGAQSPFFVTSANASSLTTFSGTLTPYTSGFGGVVVSPDSTTAYFTVPSQNDVVPLDLSTGTFGTPISVGSKPEGLDITPDGSALYVADAGGQTISVVNLSNDSVSTVITPSGFLADTPWQIVVGNNNTALFTTTFAGSGFGAAAYILNLSTDAITQLPGLEYNDLVTEDTRLARSADYSTAVLSLGDDSGGPLSIYNFGSQSVVNADLQAFISYPAVNGDGSEVAVNTGGSTMVLSGSTGHLLATIPGSNLAGVAINQGGTEGYALGQSDLESLDLSKYAVTGATTIPGGASGTGQLVFSSDGSTLVGIASSGALVFHQAPATSPTFTSATSATGTVGTRLSFTVTTSGNPIPAITETGSLPSGITFTDNGNGTATLSGYLEAGSVGTFPITFTAANSAGTSTQNFALTVSQPVVPPNVTSVMPSDGQPGSFVLVRGSGFGTQPLSGTHSGATGSECLFRALCTAGVSVKFGSASTAIAFVSASEIGVFVPKGSGTVDVTVTIGGQSSNQSTDDQFTYAVPPTVTGVTPNQGGNFSLVEIEGSGMLPVGSPSSCLWPNCPQGLEANFGSVQAWVLWATPTWMLVLAPPGVGKVDVTVSLDGVMSQRGPSDQFTYNGGPPSFI